jgi:hypothetical protein
MMNGGWWIAGGGFADGGCADDGLRMVEDIHGSNCIYVDKSALTPRQRSIYGSSPKYLCNRIQ